MKDSQQQVQVCHKRAVCQQHRDEAAVNKVPSQVGLTQKPDSTEHSIVIGRSWICLCTTANSQPSCPILRSLLGCSWSLRRECSPKIRRTIAQHMRSWSTVLLSSVPRAVITQCSKARPNVLKSWASSIRFEWYLRHDICTLTQSKLSLGSGVRGRANSIAADAIAGWHWSDVVT